MSAYLVATAANQSQSANQPNRLKKGAAVASTTAPSAAAPFVHATRGNQLRMLSYLLLAVNAPRRKIKRRAGLHQCNGTTQRCQLGSGTYSLHVHSIGYCLGLGLVSRLLALGSQETSSQSRIPARPSLYFLPFLSRLVSVFFFIFAT